MSTGLKLYLKGSNVHGKGKKRLGDCFKCQRVLLVMKLKGLDFEIRYIDERVKRTDEDYKKICATTTPVLVYEDVENQEDVEYQEADDIVSFLEKYGPSLKSGDVAANALASKATPMSSLNGWIKNTDPSRNKALEEKLFKTLDEIDQVLGSKEGAFLDGDELKLPDCILLPKLYCAKVAALFVKDYDITKFQNIKKYLNAAMKIQAFQESCPLEEEITEKWKAYKK